MFGASLVDVDAKEINMNRILDRRERPAAALGSIDCSRGARSAAGPSMARVLVRGVAALCLASSIGLASPALAAAQTFANTAPITINDGGLCEPPGAASPYPSQISVSGLTGTITDVNVTLAGLTHAFPDDVGVLLVGPAGQKTILMADTGGSDLFPVSGVNLTFDDAASASLSDESQITSGTYKPTIGTSLSGCIAPSSFPAPAPAGPYGVSLSVFNDTSPNGTWSLYVIDDTLEDTGSISGGWSLDISVQAPDAAEKIADLQELVAGLGLPKGLTTALNSALDEALAALDADDTAGACDSLQAFLNQVAARNGKKLTAAQAQQLSDAANEIRALLDC
jgi:subtilisin-like proprotein convertase family protein